MSDLRFARVFQLLHLLVGLSCLFVASSDAADSAKDALLIVGSLLTAIVLIGLKCDRCGYSMYRTRNFRINLLVPAARVCVHCGTPRS